MPPTTAIQPIEPHFISVKDARKILNVSATAMYQYINSGAGPPVSRLSTKCIRIPYKEFMEWARNPPPLPPKPRKKTKRRI